MASVRKARFEDFDLVYPLFSGFREPRPSKEQFRELFKPRWNSTEAYCGFILEGDSGQPVGYLGTLFSHRWIGGREEKFCNLNCWIVDPEYRSEGLSLLFQVLKLKEYTVTNFTGNRVAPILQRFGFKPLDQTYQILIPVPKLGGIGCGCKLLTRPDQLSNALTGQDRLIYEDHQGLAYHHIALKSQAGLSYMVVNRIKKRGLPVLQLHYLSNVDNFRQHIQHLLPGVCWHFKTVGLLVGDHFLHGYQFPWTIKEPQRQLRLFRSDRVKQEEMDTLYSELEVLNL